MTDANSAAEVLEIKGLTKSLGSRNILCDINLSVNSGEVFGFLGPNGHKAYPRTSEYSEG